MRRAEHELTDMGDVVRSLGFRTKKAPEGPKKRKHVPNGVCNFDGCPGEAMGWAKRPQLRCGARAATAPSTICLASSRHTAACSRANLEPAAACMAEGG